MKKLSIVIAALILTLGISSFDAQAIGITLKIEFGKHTPEGNCGPGKGICSITIGGSLLSVSDANSGTGVQVVPGTAELRDGKLYVTVSKGIQENGKNERGAYALAIKENGIKKSITIDPAVAKELGVSSLVIAPGNYQFNGNTIVFNVKGPRDAASGMATGKR
ncbi:MAG TPA: hypothetical protein VFG54_03645 [Prolixibacteraceae bacterium]|nr:hypothetical protein [Prolixibacteraceae bacterium]